MRLDFLTSAEIAEHARSYHAAFYKKVLQPGAVVWDVGAFRGVMSFLFANDGYKVVAIEGAPANMEALRNNVEDEVTILPFAISDHAKRIMTQFNDCRNHQNQVVSYRTLDDLLRLCKSPALIKLDIEGMETLALKGATRLLTEIRPIWQISMHEGLNVRYTGYPGFVPVSKGGFDFSTIVEKYLLLRCDNGQEVQTLAGFGEFFAIPREMLEVAA